MPGGLREGKNKTIECVEGDQLRRFSSQHIELVCQRMTVSGLTIAKALRTPGVSP